MVQKAKLDIEVGTDKAVQKTKQIQQEFKKMGAEGTQAGDKISQGANKAKSSLNNLGNEAGEAKRDMAALSVSVLGLGQAVGGVSDQIFGFNEKLVALEKSKFGLEETTEDLKRAEEDFKSSLEEGFQSVQERQRAETDLMLLRKKLKIETKEVTAEEEALNSEFANFGLNIGQTVIFTYLTLNTALSASTKSMIASKVAQLGLSRVITAGIPILQLSTLATIKATFASQGLAMGIKSVFVAMGPIGLALIGITAAWAIWESNIGGVQEKLAELWTMLKNFIPMFQALETLVTNLFPEASAEMQVFDSTVQNTTESLSGYDLMLGQTASDTSQLTDTTSSLGSTMGGVPAWYQKAAGSVEKYTEKLTDSQKATQDWIRMQEEASKARFLGSDVSGGTELENGVNTGILKKVRRKKALVDASTMAALRSIDPTGAISGNFRVSTGSREVLTAGLQRQRAENIRINKERDRLRDKRTNDRKAKGFLKFAQFLGFGDNLTGVQNRRGLFRKVGLAENQFQNEFSDFGVSLRDKDISREKIADLRNKISFSERNQGLVGLSVSQLNTMQMTGTGMRTINNSLSYQDRVKMFSSGAS